MLLLQFAGMKAVLKMQDCKSS